MKLSIINPGGVDNFGERAILVGTLYDLKDKYPEAKIVIYGYQSIAKLDPPMYKLMQDYDVKLYPELIRGQGARGKALHLVRLLVAARQTIGAEAFDHLVASELVVAKGQESLTSSYGWLHFIDSVLEPVLASYHNPRVVLYGHSVGPVSSRLQRRVARLALRRMHHVYARDERSREMLLSLAYPSQSVTVIKDLAYTAVRRIPELQGHIDRRHYLVIPNAAIIKTPADQERYLGALRVLLDDLTARHEPIILASSVAATGWNNDYDLCEQLAAEYPSARLKRYRTLNELLLDIKASKKVISSRLHPLIMATGMGTPILALSQAPKVAGILSDFTGPGYSLIHPFNSSEDILLNAL